MTSPARTASPLLSAALKATSSRRYEVVSEDPKVKNTSFEGLYSAVRDELAGERETGLSFTVYEAGSHRGVAFVSPDQSGLVGFCAAADELERAVLSFDWDLR